MMTKGGGGRQKSQKNDDVFYEQPQRLSTIYVTPQAYNESQNVNKGGTNFQISTKALILYISLAVTK